MSSPFRAIAPFTPRIIPVDYQAFAPVCADGNGCSVSQSAMTVLLGAAVLQANARVDYGLVQYQTTSDKTFTITNAAPLWVSNQPYAAWVYVVDPINSAVYLSIGSVTSDVPPSEDPAHWEQYSGSIDTLYLGTAFSSSPDFTVISQPQPVLQPGYSTTLTVRANSGTMSQKNAVISIPNSTGTNPFNLYLTASVLGVTTYQGTIKWYGFKPYDYVAGSTVSDYYLTKSASGGSTQIQTMGPPAGTPIGTIDVQNLGGSVSISPINGSQSGTMSCNRIYNGMLCQGSSFSYPTNLSVPASSTNMADLLAWYNTIQIGHTTRKFITFDFPPLWGLTTYCDNSMWGDPSKVATETLTNKMTLAQAKTAGGAATIAPSLTSSTTSYDSGTGVQVGTASAINVVSPSASKTGKAILTANYSQTPTGGGATTYFSDIQFYSPGVGNPLNVLFHLPMVVGYDITLLSYTIQDVDDRSDDFEDEILPWIGDNDGNYIAPISWTDFPVFGMLLPGSMCASDFSDGAQGWISYDTGGYYWNGTGLFSQTSYTEVSDDFEAYAVGVIAFAGRGAGWDGVGTFLAVQYPQAFDDFESYAVGVIASIAYGNYDFANSNYWSGAGGFVVAIYGDADDDMESYPIGLIALISGGAGVWNGSGSFTVT